MMGSILIENAPPLDGTEEEAVVSSPRQQQQQPRSPQTPRRTLSSRSIKCAVYSKVFPHHHQQQNRPCNMLRLGKSKSARTLCCSSSKELFQKTTDPRDDDEEEEDETTVTMGSSSFMFKPAVVKRDSLMIEQRKHSSLSRLNGRRRSNISHHDDVLGGQEEDTNGGGSNQQRGNDSSFGSAEEPSNLSFADAKRIWMREWLRSQRRSSKNNNEHTYVESTFDTNDLVEQSLQQQQSSIPRRIDFAGTVVGPSSSTKTSSTRTTSTSSILSQPITEEEEEETENEEEENRITFKPFEHEDSEAAIAVAVATTLSTTINGTTTTSTSPAAVATPADDGCCSNRRTVTFTTITIQEYPIIPGDTPGGTYGVPITIDWVPYDAVEIDLVSYEKWRIPHRRNHQQEMQIPWFHREQILKRLGFNSRQIREASRQASIARRQRRKSNSITTFYLDGTMYRLELLVRTFRNILTLGQKKRKEREYLAQSNSSVSCC